MTGLYENISDLKNEKNLTFLYRASQIRLKPFDFGTIAENYMDTFGVEQKVAEKNSALTKEIKEIIDISTRYYDNPSPLAPVLRNNKIVKASKNRIFRLDRIGRMIDTKMFESYKLLGLSVEFKT